MTERGEIVWPKPTTDLMRIGSAAVVSGLVLAGCTTESSTEQPTVTHTIIATPPAESPTLSEPNLPEASATETEVSAGDCNWRRVYVDRYHTPENVEAIEDQMRALNGLYGLDDDSFRLRDNLTEFPSIMADSFRDPEYAHALKLAVDDLNSSSPVDAERFLDYEVMDIDTNACTDNHIPDVHMEAANFYFVAANNDILRALGDHVADRGSELAGQAYETLVRQYRNLCEQIGQSDNCLNPSIG